MAEDIRDHYKGSLTFHRDIGPIEISVDVQDKVVSTEPDPNSGYQLEFPEPTGTIEITTNGTHDVAAYANANVSIPGSFPYDRVCKLNLKKSANAFNCQAYGVFNNLQDGYMSSTGYPASYSLTTTATEVGFYIGSSSTGLNEYYMPLFVNNATPITVSGTYGSSPTIVASATQGNGILYLIVLKLRSGGAEPTITVTQ